MILLGVGLSGVTTLAGMVARALRSPHGEWDAWAIWNLHARFIFRDPEHPLRYVDENVAWSHPDYPLLLPLIVVRGWIINGGESPVVPMLVGPLYLLAGAGLLYFGVAALQGRATARLALLALLSAPFAAAIATGQLADIPLACNELLCVVCCLLAIGLREPRYLVIAGFASSLAAWTKNEGLFLPGALVVPCILPLLRGAFDIALRRALWLGLGLLPGMGTLLLFWHRVGGYSSGARAGTDWNRTLSQLRTPARYWTVAGRFLLEPLAVAKWGPAPFIAAAYPLALGVNGNGLIRRAAMVCGVVLALLVAMDFMTFMVITEDLKWFLDGSLDRLLLHSFPAVLAVLFALGRPLATADPARD